MGCRRWRASDTEGCRTKSPPRQTLVPGSHMGRSDLFFSPGERHVRQGLQCVASGCKARVWWRATGGAALTWTTTSCPRTTRLMTGRASRLDIVPSQISDAQQRRKVYGERTRHPCKPPQLERDHGELELPVEPATSPRPAFLVSGIARTRRRCPTTSPCRRRRRRRGPLRFGCAG